MQDPYNKTFAGLFEQLASEVERTCGKEVADKLRQRNDQEWIKRYQSYFMRNKLDPYFTIYTSIALFVMAITFAVTSLLFVTEGRYALGILSLSACLVIRSVLMYLLKKFTSERKLND